MSEQIVVINVHFDACDGTAERRLDSFKPLADERLTSFQERLNKALVMLEYEDRGPKKYRLEALAKIYGDYLWIDKFETLSPLHYRFTFVCGSAGVDFARDVCFMLFVFGVAEITATISYDEYAGVTVFKLQRDALWEQRPPLD